MIELKYSTKLFAFMNNQHHENEKGLTLNSFLLSIRANSNESAISVNAPNEP